MSDGMEAISMIKGTKEIVPFIRNFINLHPDQSEAWRTLKRWKKLKGFPIEYAPNDEPYLIAEKFYDWWNSLKADVSKRGSKEIIHES